jgi:hypothetical protein
MSAPIILLAAGDPRILMALLSEFPRDKWQPMAAKDGHQVARALEGRALHIAIIHEQLGDMPGKKLCVWLKKYRSSVPIVTLTTGLPPSDTGDEPWDAALRYPAAAGVLRDVAAGALHAARDIAPARARFVQAIRSRAERLDTQNYFEVLGLPIGANQNQLRAAYDKLSLRYHPDRHPYLRGLEGEAELSHLYKRIGEAYRILTDPEKRPQYDKQLGGGTLRFDDSQREKVGPRSIADLSDNPMIKKFLKLAHTAEATGNLTGALQQLKFAQSMDRDNEALAEKIAELEARN